MTTLTDPVHIEVPASTPVQPAATLDPPRRPDGPRTTPRRSRRFTNRTSAAAPSYASRRACGNRANSTQVRSPILSGEEHARGSPPSSVPPLVAGKA